MAKDTKKPNPMRVVTGKVRLSYVYLAKPDYDEEHETHTFRAMIMIPKSDVETLKKMKIAIKAAAVKKFGDKAPRMLKHQKFSKALRNPAAEDMEGKEYEGMYFLTAKNKERPGLILKNGARVEREADIDKHFYSGVWVNCSLNFFGFDTKGNKGVAVWLNNIIKNADGERLDGRVAAEDELAEFIDEDDTSMLDDDDDDLMGDDDDDDDDFGLDGDDDDDDDLGL